ncbi:MAG: DUF6797 domain-containing protein [Planctomycetaceae bacterium]
MRCRHISVLISFSLLTISSRGSLAQTLEKRLHREPVVELVAAARKLGDSRRGAVVFHQPLMACSRCHDMTGSQQETLGPNLAVWQQKVDDSNIVESVLYPSKAIRRGYQPIQVVTTGGKNLIGLFHTESVDTLELRDPASGRLIRVAAGDIEERHQLTTSIMPGGQVNQLTSRQQFLDLLKYLFEIRDGGMDRAKELQPPVSMFALTIPEYESHVDHAGLIADLSHESLKRGEAIYHRLCINCHGDQHKPGSLPTAVRFTEDRFKNGNDPHAMYRTLTHGFGFMVAQTWMVPQQKYDVIHYIRETWLKQYNPSQYAELDDDYLARLPRGNTRGPEPAAMDHWATMDYGPRLINTYEVGTDGSNFAYKGIAVRLDPGPGGIARGSAWMIFDHDTMRMAAAWTADPEAGGTRFIDWNGIHFNGRHGAHPRVVGEVQVANPTGPGWADPATDELDDLARVVGRDDRRYGPLPRPWAQYHGLYASGDRTIVDYSVGTTRVLEMPGMIVPSDSGGTVTGEGAFTRSFNIGRRDESLTLVVGTASDDSILSMDGSVARLGRPQRGSGVAAGLSVDIPGAKWVQRENRLCLTLPAGNRSLKFVLWFAKQEQTTAVEPLLTEVEPDLELRKSDNTSLWNPVLSTNVTPGNDNRPFAVDFLTPPENNPWLARTRLTGLDFHDDGDTMAICSWDGDVWIVRGLKNSMDRPTLTWQRIANGLFQPLGLKIIDGRIFVTCRDQIVVLEDNNGDGETDYYRCFNNDHQVTEHFHEFAMGLQADADGNLYYAKSARHAKTALVPHHGTLLRVSADGARTDILANGFRAANGVCLNPDGSFVVTDQEGHWNPKNRINWVREGGFYGNMFGYHDVTDSSDSAMEQPLCWITNEFDRSPGELLWVDSESWGPLNGSLLNLSYGYGKVYVVPFEVLDGQPQGGMCELPIDQFPTGTMRGRFHPADGHLYTCGMFAWAGSRTHPGGLYRLRATGKPAWLPRGLTTHPEGISIEFTDALDASAAENPDHYQIKVWSLKRTANYGSEHYDEHMLKVAAAEVLQDGRTVRLTVPGIGPTWCMEIRCQVRTPDGRTEERVIHNTIHRLND